MVNAAFLHVLSLEEVLINALLTQPAAAAFSFGIILLGAPGYLIWRTKVAP